LKLRSKINIVKAPAKTGNDKSKRNTVTKIDQTKSLKYSIDKQELRVFMTVDIKLIEPKIELIPAKCKLKINKSTPIPE
jgi:outer membrane lipopolysaccharide assembly protein LptE/RlpB